LHNDENNFVVTAMQTVDEQQKGSADGTTKLVYFQCSTLSSTVYDGGSNINAHMLDWAARNRGFKISAFCTNLSRKTLLHRVALPVDPMVIVREHGDESLFTGLRRNLMSALAHPDFRALRERGDVDYVYSASDFWPDWLPGWLIKRRHPRVTWISGFYLFAPKPWQRDNPYSTGPGRWCVGLLYWLTQLPAYWLIRHSADYVLVTSEPDVPKFVTRRRPRERVLVVQGGVDVDASESYLRGGHVIPVVDRKYDACFVGRLHYQKGVLELVDIWKHVIRSRPDARLAMIGAGALDAELRAKVISSGLQNSIDLLGFRDGAEKFEVFKQSRIVVHPATYDSGGMAAAEAMAWRLPGVAFDLDALKTYYPKGMLKTEPGNLAAFAQNILALLQDEKLYRATAEDAYQLIQEKWVWETRLRSVATTVFG
jgi:glycosyltransferase involved in cell wall biosynthesis